MSEIDYQASSEARSSWTQSRPVGTRTALGLALIAAQVWAEPGPTPGAQPNQPCEHRSTNQVSVLTEGSERELLQVLRELYSRVADSQIVLDQETMGILVDNLWDLYE